MQNTKSKTWGARRKGLTLLFLSLALSFFPLSYSFISRTVGMHRNVLIDIIQRGEDGYIIDAMTIGVGEWFIFDPMVKDDWDIATNKEFEGTYIVVED